MLMWIPSSIDDLVYLKGNITTVKKKSVCLMMSLTCWWKHTRNTMTVFQVRRSMHVGSGLSDTDKVLSFKHRTFNLLRENEDDQKSNSAPKTRCSISLKHSSKCRKSSTSWKWSSKGRRYQGYVKTDRIDGRRIIYGEERLCRQSWTWRKYCLVVIKGQSVGRIRSDTIIWKDGK